jgi:hypothetical protein
VDAAPSLRDCWQRVNWAHDNGHAFQRAVRDFIASDPYSIHIEPDGERWKASLHRRIDPTVEKRTFSEFARLFGAFLDDMRAGLNYLTYQLALLSLIEDPTLKLNLRRVEFPIFDDPDTYRANNQIKALPEKYARRIEAVQPYDGTHKDLWVLHELARKHRHRLVQPMAVTSIRDYLAVLGTEGITDIEVEYHGESLKHGDVIVTFAGYAGGDVYPNVPLAISVDDPLCADRLCVNVMNGIGAEVGPIIESFDADLPSD